MLSSHCLKYLLIFATFQLKSSATTQDVPLIPLLCDSIKCPPESEMQCPEDSSEREMLVDLFKTNAVTIAPLATTEKTSSNASVIDEELFAQCCLSKKCVCRTCYIPDCTTDNDEVVVEYYPENMDKPGHCCGQYDCMREPNCTEIRDTDFYWLRQCQRCQCTSGTRICHQTCDEGAEYGKRNAFCESKKLNTFYEDGETWKDGCYECECVKGEKKCVIPFCGNVNCPSERQVLLKDSCCPVCWPKGEPMPHEKQQSYDEGYGDYNIKVHEEEATDATIAAVVTVTANSSVTSSASAELNVPKSTTALSTLPQDNVTLPCQADIRDFPKIVEVVHKPENNDLVLIIAFVEFVVIVLLGFYIRHLRAKQRSYRPVMNNDNKVYRTV